MHPIGQSVYHVTARLSAIVFRRDSTDAREKVEKEMASLTGDEIEVSTESAQV